MFLHKENKTVHSLNHFFLQKKRIEKIPKKKNYNKLFFTKKKI